MFGDFVISFSFLIISLLTSLVCDVSCVHVKSAESVGIGKVHGTPCMLWVVHICLLSLRAKRWEGIYIVPSLLPFQHLNFLVANVFYV